MSRITCTELQKGRLLVAGDFFKIIFSRYGKATLYWDDQAALHGNAPPWGQMVDIFRECLGLELDGVMLVEPDWVRGAKCMDDIKWMIRGKILIKPLS
jgi:hypothetical protein